MQIVETLQQRGESVVVVGDGLNDAPAVRAADVGIAFGTAACDITRSAADLLVLNDDFSSLVTARAAGASFK